MSRDLEFVRSSGAAIDGSLRYRADEYSFGFHPSDVYDPAVLLFGTVQLEIDSAGRCRSVVGYSPFHGWAVESLPPLPSIAAGVCHVQPLLEPGSVVSVCSVEETAITFDQMSGRILIRPKLIVEFEWACEIGTGMVILAGPGGRPGALLLQPQAIDLPL